MSNRTTRRGCVLAIVCVATALLVTRAIQNPIFPTPLFFASILISTWYGGVIPGVLAVSLATLALNYYYIPPTGSLSLFKPETLYLIEFVIPALMTCSFVKKRRVTEFALRRSRDELESKVRERQAELAHITRMMTVGELGVSVAHEVNQPLMAVVLNGDAGLRWLDANPPNLPEARAAIGRVIEEGNRAAEIVRRIRTLSKKTAPQRVRVDLNEAIQETLPLLERELHQHRIQLTTVLDPRHCQVLGDPIQVQQVILNLTMNAIESIQATGGRRELTVRTAGGETGYVTVTVADSGAGLPPGDPEQLFAAFYTTKEQGLGMGLAISRTIVETHGGRLWATDAGTGATFQFQLPSA